MPGPVSKSAWAAGVVVVTSMLFWLCASEVRAQAVDPHAPNPPIEAEAGVAAADGGAPEAGRIAQDDVQPQHDIPAEPAPPAAQSIMEWDVQPTVKVLKTDDVEIRAGGLVQIHASPYVGGDALIENGDPASGAGFRLRRAGFGLEGRKGNKMGALLAVNPIQGGQEPDRAISNAILWYEVGAPLRATIGTVKVPYSLAALESARTLVGIERPLAVNLLAPSRRLGVNVEGHLFDGHFAYLVGVLNGTEGFALGNQYGGYLGGARIEGILGARPNAWERRDGLMVGLDAVHGDTPAVSLFAYSGDVYGAYKGAHVKVEALCDRQSPKEEPTVSPALPDTLRRCGGYVETGYVLPWIPLQPAVRAEVMDDNMAVADAGDTFILDGGFNLQLIKSYARAQLHYIHRSELKSVQRKNDAVIFAIQGNF